MSTKKEVAATRDANNIPIIMGDLVHFVFENIYASTKRGKKIIYVITEISFNEVKIATNCGRKKTYTIPSDAVMIVNTASARELLAREKNMHDSKTNKSLTSNVRETTKILGSASS